MRGPILFEQCRTDRFQETRIVELDAEPIAWLKDIVKIGFR